MQHELWPLTLVELLEAGRSPLPFGRKDARHDAVRAETTRSKMGELGHEALAGVVGDAWKWAEARQKNGVSPPHHLGCAIEMSV